MRFSESYFSNGLSGVTGSAIRDIFKLLGKPGMISFAGGNPSMRALEPEVIRGLSSEAIDRYGANILQYGGTEGLPDHVGANAVSVGRVAARVVRALVLRISRYIRPRALDEVGVIVDPVAVGIIRALYILKAEILRAVYMKMTVEHHYGSQNDHRTDA